MTVEEWKQYDNALEKLHFLANMYRVSGHMSEDVMGPYTSLKKMLYEIKPEEEEPIKLTKSPKPNKILKFRNK